MDRKRDGRRGRESEMEIMKKKQIRKKKKNSVFVSRSVTQNTRPL